MTSPEDCAIKVVLHCHGCDKLLIAVSEDEWDSSEPFTIYCQDCLLKIGQALAEAVMPIIRKEVKDDSRRMADRIPTEE